MKNIVLIRHGQSLGQTARANGLSRSDEVFTDCFLTKKGMRQASELRSDVTLSRYHFDLVCTSPLTRAVATCVLALGHIAEKEIEESAGSVPIRTTPFIAHPYISEAGSGIPENNGRSLPVLKKDLKTKLSMAPPSALSCLDHIDFSLLPDSWGHFGDGRADRSWHVAKSEKEGKLESFLHWLLDREESNIAVVCHYNIIRWLLGNVIGHVPNCVPIECILLEDGDSTGGVDAARLVLKSAYESGEYLLQAESFKQGKTKKHRAPSKKLSKTKR